MSRDRKDLSNLCKALGYEFQDEAILRNALTHSSYCYEHKLSYNENNERLEFLGDAVFDAVIADEMYARLTDNEEGDLSRLRGGCRLRAVALSESGRAASHGLHASGTRGTDVFRS